MYRKTPTSVLIWYFFPAIFPKLDGGSNLAFRALQKILTTFVPGQPLHREVMWAWLLAHANTTWCSLGCLSTRSWATPSNYFNHAFILPPACSAQPSWNSPGNYSKIKWEAELKHASSGGREKGQATTQGSVSSLGMRASPCPTFLRFAPLTHPAHMGDTCLDREGGNVVFFLCRKDILQTTSSHPHPLHWLRTHFVVDESTSQRDEERERRGQGDV